MSFHDAAALEVALMFQDLSGGGGRYWLRVEDALWLRRQREHAAWAEHGQWWRKTSIGKRYEREYKRSQRALLRKRVVAIAGCKGCGKPFERTAYDLARRRGRVCSVECRGRARSNIELVRIGREAMPLARWAERYGLDLKTVCARRARGWDVLRALQTPAANRGQKRKEPRGHDLIA